MSINPRFQEYFQEAFFQGKDEEFKKFLDSLDKSIPRTIRIKPGEEEKVLKNLSQYGFILTPTNIYNVYSLDRSEDFDPFERRIGYTLDHLLGNFYIQELAAATSVTILADGKICDEPFLILDMAASPGWKTTQLAEYYPNSFIVANEPTRERIPQLLQNLDRMGSTTIGVTLYPWQYFSRTPELFDRILLDAPCSGEGTLYKWTDATKHWHIKNIKTIARLQEKLIHAAIIALKVWWEMVYSTCSMNLLENEGVLNSLREKFNNNIEIFYEKRFWPHIDNTGGFFVAKIRKIGSIASESEKKNLHKNINENIHFYREKNILSKPKKWYILYEHLGNILALKENKELEKIRDMFYFMRWWESIGREEEWVFVPSLLSHRYLDIPDNVPRYEIPDELTLDTYLRGGNIEDTEENGEYLLTYQWNTIGKEKISEWIMTNHFPRDWQRK